MRATILKQVIPPADEKTCAWQMFGSPAAKDLLLISRENEIRRQYEQSF